MSTGTVILLVLLLVVIAVAAGLASTLVHRQAARRRRVDGLGLKPLTAERRSWYQSQWAGAQEKFIDSPPQATTTAAGLVTAVAAERGYDVGDAGRLLADLSVHHGRYLDGYRRAMRTTGEAMAAGTEELRQALLGHRALFLDLLDASTADGSATSGGRRATGSLRLPWRPVMPPLNRGTRRRDRDGVAAARS